MNIKNATDALVCLVSQASQMATVSLSQITDIGNFVETNFDCLDLSQLRQRLLVNGDLKTFNAYMVLENKYFGFSKMSIPFELDLKDYLLADEIMKMCCGD